MRVYLTPREAARALGLSPRTLQRRLYLSQIPHLAVSPRVLRIEAAAVDSSLPDPSDVVPARVRVEQLAELLRVHVSHVYDLMARGHLPRRTPWKRRQIIRFLIDHTVETPPWPATLVSFD